MVIHIESPDWIKKKKTTVTSKHEDKFVWYAATVALNYEEIKWNKEFQMLNC